MTAHDRCYDARYRNPAIRKRSRDGVVNSNARRTERAFAKSYRHSVGQECKVRVKQQRIKDWMNTLP